MMATGRRITAAALLLGLLLGGRLSADEVEDRAAEVITGLGGKVYPKQKARGSPIIRVDLGPEAVKGGALQELKNFPHLQTLRLYNSGITDAGLKDLKGLRRLVNLDLTVTRVSDPGMA